jgi:hypothetical protein
VSRLRWRSEERVPHVRMAWLQCLLGYTSITALRRSAIRVRSGQVAKGEQRASGRLNPEIQRTGDEDSGGVTGAVCWTRVCTPAAWLSPSRRSGDGQRGEWSDAASQRSVWFERVTSTVWRRVILTNSRLTNGQSVSRLGRIVSVAAHLPQQIRRRR